MASSFLSNYILILIFYFSTQKYIESDIFLLSSQLGDKNPNYSNLKEWLNNLVINIPNELLENTTHGILDNIMLYDINLDRIITTSHEVLDNKIRFNISITNIESSVKVTNNAPSLSSTKDSIYVTLLTSGYLKHVCMISYSTSLMVLHLDYYQ